jgi:von Willebrand factor type A domain-containing protein
MIDRQRLVTYGISTTAAATVALALWLKPWASGGLISPPPPPPAANHRIDVVFAVDTTGSMGGLLDGAKRTVWAIANRIKEIDSQADLHVGLVAYRDLGDEYVTKDFALTSDMDGVFAELSSYYAGGGGDTPEDVDAALYDAVHKMQWRDGAKKMIFLVGDAPPASRGEVPRFEETARVAADKQIVINAIRCGGDSETQVAWQQIASIGHGEFSSIREDGGVQQIATPYDDKLAALAHTVDETTVVYGDASVHHAYEGKMAYAAAAPTTAKADRAAYIGKGGAAAPEDLVAQVAAGSANVATIDTGMLPADMRDKSKAEIAKDLAQKAEQRAQAQKEITELTKQRAKYLETHGTAGGDGFDTAVKSTLEKELK